MPKEKLKECKKHGLVRHVIREKNYYRCTKCTNGYVISRRMRIKKLLVDEHGGKCIKCGYSKYIGALHFHHRDRVKKLFQIGGGSISIERLRKEAKKCDLLCSNCHHEVTHKK